MSTKREPLVSDGYIRDAYTSDENWAAITVRDTYESARAKDGELMQRAVDELQQIADEGYWTPRLDALLNDFEAAGFTPSK